MLKYKVSFSGPVSFGDPGCVGGLMIWAQGRLELKKMQVLCRWNQNRLGYLDSVSPQEEHKRDQLLCLELVGQQEA